MNVVVLDAFSQTVCEYLSASLLSSADLLLCLKVLLLEIVVSV